MNRERIPNPFPFGTVETASDVYAAAGYVEEAGELLDARIATTPSDMERSRLHAKRLSLPFHYIKQILNEPEVFSRKERAEIDSDIEASYGRLGELLESELRILEALETQLVSENETNTRVKIQKAANDKIGRITEITFQALAARGYSYTDNPDTYAVPASEEIDRYGNTRASDMVFYLTRIAENEANSTKRFDTEVLAQVKTADTTLNLKNASRKAQGLPPFSYDKDIAMLFLNKATNSMGGDTFRLDNLTLPRAIIAELDGTSTQRQEELITHAVQYVREEINKVAEFTNHNSQNETDDSGQQKMPEQVGA